MIAAQLPGGSDTNPFDHSDAFPRYYFGLDVARDQIEQLLRKRGYKAGMFKGRSSSAVLYPGADP